MIFESFEPLAIKPSPNATTEVTDSLPSFVFQILIVLSADPLAKLPSQSTASEITSSEKKSLYNEFKKNDILHDQIK
ncbi:hypothetical protein BpHYR1_026301 [Brachionus plicatilis]|uniref:Uncharacterized protein n=1 Tax=Brachionus plicatilis TaxID=10195 RepID=A0A3M7P5S6_BRAPC|nr:hypothetical protein BpHYR1_026301 [Brachionus plicatilis]